MPFSASFEVVHAEGLRKGTGIGKDFERSDSLTAIAGHKNRREFEEKLIYFAEGRRKGTGTDNDLKETTSLIAIAGHANRREVTEQLDNLPLRADPKMRSTLVVHQLPDVGLNVVA